jgi:camelysin-like metallo-endopeptidase
MSLRNINKKRLVAAAAAPVALLASGGMVWAASYSAFSATTVSPTSNWTSGTVSLSDDDNDTALFTASNLKPGATGTKCINVTSTGSLASAVKLYGTSYTTTKGLADNINLKVEQGTGSTNAACSGFTTASTLYDGVMSTFGTTKTSFATGVGSWAPTGSASETKSFKVTYTLSTTTPDTAQGGTAALGFTWESQNS